MPAPLSRPRGAALARSGRARSPCSGQPSWQPLEWRQLLGKAAPKSPSPGHSAFPAGPSPPLLPCLPPSRGGKEGSPALSSQGAEGAGPSVSSARRFPGSRAGLAPSPEPGGSPPRRARATRPVSSSRKRLLPPPPLASPPAPASAGSRSPPPGELQTRKQLLPHPRLEPRGARLQVHRNRAPAPAPFEPGGRGARPRSPAAGQWPGTHRRGAPRPAAPRRARSEGALPTEDFPRCRPTEKRSSRPGAGTHLRHGRQAQVELEGGEEKEEAREPERRGRPRPPSHSERWAGDSAWPSGRGPGWRWAPGGEVPFPNLYRDGSSRVQLGPILFVRLSCRE